MKLTNRHKYNINNIKLYILYYLCYKYKLYKYSGNNLQPNVKTL